jgi:hypothetical protein
MVSSMFSTSSTETERRKSSSFSNSNSSRLSSDAGIPPTCEIRHHLDQHQIQMCTHGGVHASRMSKCPADGNVWISNYLNTPPTLAWRRRIPELVARPAYVHIKDGEWIPIASVSRCTTTGGLINSAGHKQPFNECPPKTSSGKASSTETCRHQQSHVTETILCFSGFVICQLYILQRKLVGRHSEGGPR